MPPAEVFPTSEAPPGLLERARTMLEQAFDGRLSDDDWEHALGGWHVVLTRGDRVLSHAAVVPRDMVFGDRPLRTGYVEAVATVLDGRRQGLATHMMKVAGEIVRREFEIGALSTGIQPFYERLGWERWNGPSFVNDDGRRVRTPGEDDGLMVLRFDASLGVPLTAPITCEARRGDDW